MEAADPRAVLHRPVALAAVDDPDWQAREPRGQRDGAQILVVFGEQEVGADFPQPSDQGQDGPRGPVGTGPCGMDGEAFLRTAPVQGRSGVGQHRDVIAERGQGSSEVEHESFAAAHVADGIGHDQLDHRLP